MKSFVISVCDGSEMVKTITLSFRHEREAEAFLKENLRTCGPHLFWKVTEKEMTIGEMTDWIRESKMTGYMLDDECWHRCRVVEDGQIAWEEVE